MKQDWKKYRRTGLSEMRPYVPGEDLAGISVSEPDKEYLEFCATDGIAPGGYVARNPQNHADQWYVAQAYFEANLEPASFELAHVSVELDAEQLEDVKAYAQELAGELQAQRDDLLAALKKLMNEVDDRRTRFGSPLMAAILDARAAIARAEASHAD